jgi:hypothetical protein
VLTLFTNVAGVRLAQAPLEESSHSAASIPVTGIIHPSAVNPAMPQANSAPEIVTVIQR